MEDPFGCYEGRKKQRKKITMLLEMDLPTPRRLHTADHLELRNAAVQGVAGRLIDATLKTGG